MSVHPPRSGRKYGRNDQDTRPRGTDAPRSACEVAADDSSEYPRWLCVPAAQDTAETGEVIGEDRPDWLAVDHYALDAAWETELMFRAMHPESRV